LIVHARKKLFFLIKFFVSFSFALSKIHKLFLKNNFFVYKDKLTNTKNICIFFVYEKFNETDQYFLNALEENKFKIFLIINTNKKLTEYSIPKHISNYCDLIIIKENVGRCFGAYKFGLKYLRKYDFFGAENMFIINNTIQVKKEKISAYIRKFLKESIKFQFNAPIISRQNEILHYQSFFLYFKNIFRDDYFWSFWNRYLPLNSRWHTINFGEIGLSKHLLKKYLSNCDVTLPNHNELYSLPINNWRAEIFFHLGTAYSLNPYYDFHTILNPISQAELYIGEVKKIPIKKANNKVGHYHYLLNNTKPPLELRKSISIPKGFLNRLSWHLRAFFEI